MKTTIKTKKEMQTKNVFRIAVVIAIAFFSLANLSARNYNNQDTIKISNEKSDLDYEPEMEVELWMVELFLFHIGKSANPDRVGILEELLGFEYEPEIEVQPWMIEPFLFQEVDYTTHNRFMTRDAELCANCRFAMKSEAGIAVDNMLVDK